MATKLDLNEKEWVNLIFANRNQEYGAYQLRKEFAKNSALGILFAILLFSFAVTAPLIVNLISGKIIPEVLVKYNPTITLAPPPSIDIIKPLPPAVETPSKLKSTIKFVPPVIVKDDNVPNEDLPPIEDVKINTPGVVTQGEPGDNPDGYPPNVSTGLVTTVPIDKIIDFAEIMPEFPGGQDELNKYIGKNVKYPAFARENNISGTVYINFVIDKDGKPINVKIERGVNKSLDEEAMRVIKNMPTWSPGKQNGQTVKVQYTIPVSFKLQ